MIGHSLAHNGRQLCGAAKRASGDDGTRDPAGMPLFAIALNEFGQSALGQRVYQLFGAGPIAAHAHIQGTVEAEGKSTLCLVDLHRGDAEIEGDAVDGADAMPRQ
jgi:hypothetical protein